MAHTACVFYSNLRLTMHTNYTSKKHCTYSTNDIQGQQNSKSSNQALVYLAWLCLQYSTVYRTINIANSSQTLQVHYRYSISVTQRMASQDNYVSIYLTYSIHTIYSTLMYCITKTTMEIFLLSTWTKNKSNLNKNWTNSRHFQKTEVQYIF